MQLKFQITTAFGGEKQPRTIENQYLCLDDAGAPITAPMGHYANRVYRPTAEERATIQRLQRAISAQHGDGWRVEASALPSDLSRCQFHALREVADVLEVGDV